MEMEKVKNVIDQVWEKSINRRQFIKKMTALGASLPAATFLFKSLSVAREGGMEKEELFRAMDAAHDLADQYEPILYLHKEEEAFPMHVDPYIRNASLWDDGNRPHDASYWKEVVPKYGITLDPSEGGRTYLGQRSGLRRPYLTRNHFLNFCGWDTDFKSYPNLNCLLDILEGYGFEEGKYYYFSELLGLEDMLSCQDKRTFSDDFITNTVGHYQVLKFYFFYPFQQKDSMYAEDGKLNQEGDWEVVAVLLEDPASPKPVLVLATQETLGMALWGEISTEGDHPKIYVAKGGHENYFSPGCHERTGAVIIDDIIDRVEDAVGDEVDEKLDDVRDAMGDVGWGLIIAAIIAAIFGCFAAAAILGAAGGILVDKSDDIPDSEEIKDRIKDKIHDTLDTENCAPETELDAFVIGKVSGADTDWKTVYNGQDDRFRGGWLDRKDIWWNYRGLWGVRVVPHQEGSGKSGPRHPDHELLKIDRRIKEKVLAYLSSE